MPRLLSSGNRQDFRTISFTKLLASSTTVMCLLYFGNRIDFPFDGESSRLLN